MPPKTERFELRLEEQLSDDLERWRHAQSPPLSKAEAARQLMELGLRTSDNSPKLQLRSADRLILSMLCEISKSVGATDEIDPGFVSSAIFGGHDWALEQEMPGVFPQRTDDRETVREVVDILDMWSFLEEAAEEFTTDDLSAIDEKAGPHHTPVKFHGFDGSNETSHMSIARFYIEDMDRFQRFAGRSLNAHHPTLTGYRAMFAEFDGIRPNVVGRRMTVDEVARVLKQR